MWALCFITTAVCCGDHVVDTTETAPTFCSVSYYAWSCARWHTGLALMGMANETTDGKFAGTWTVTRATPLLFSWCSKIFNRDQWSPYLYLGRLCCQWLGKLLSESVTLNQGSFVHCYSHALNLATSGRLSHQTLSNSDSLTSIEIAKITWENTEKNGYRG